MDTAAITTYIAELKYHKLLKEKPTLDEYREELDRLEFEFENCIFQCKCENAEFNINVPAIRIEHIIDDSTKTIVSDSSSRKSADNIEVTKIIRESANRALNHLSEYPDYNCSRIEKRGERKTGWICSWQDLLSLYPQIPITVKNRKWRIENKFPFHQICGSYSKVYYHDSEVEKWLRERQIC